MCLSSEKLKMRFWPKYNTYYGEGFKNLDKGYKKFDMWQEATGWSKKVHSSKTGLEYERTYTNLDGKIDNEYPAGFHIFLNIEDAKNYSKDSYELGYRNVYKVDFTDVIGFGKQYSGGSDVDCVITRWMYVRKEPVSVYKPKMLPPPGYMSHCKCSRCSTYTKYLKNV